MSAQRTPEQNLIGDLWRELRRCREQLAHMIELHGDQDDGLREENEDVLAGADAALASVEAA